MIKLQEYTPEVYYKKSRDFQFIGRLYDVVLNYIKTNTTLVSNLSTVQEMSAQLLDLMVTTLGFHTKHNYNIGQLRTICSVLPIIFRKKGSLDAIKLIGDAVCRAEGVTDDFNCYVDITETNIVLAIPLELSDVSLLRDLLNYVMPAGMTYSIINATVNNTAGTTSATSADNVIAYNVNEKELSIVLGKTTDFTNSNTVSPAVRNAHGVIMNSTVVQPSLSAASGTNYPASVQSGTGTSSGEGE